MFIKGRIDDVIESGWRVLDSDFDQIAFHHWRQSALDCLTDMLGPDHVYTRHFENIVREGGKKDLLAGNGILSVVRQGIAGSGLELFNANGSPKAVPDLTEKAGDARGIVKTAWRGNDGTRPTGSFNQFGKRRSTTTTRKSKKR